VFVYCFLLTDGPVSIYSVQAGSSIEAIIIVGIVIVFFGVGVYVWRVLRRAQVLLRSISVQVRSANAPPVSFVKMRLLSYSSPLMLSAPLFFSSKVKGDYNVAVAKSAIEEGSAIQKRIEGTVAVVFIFFLLRAIYASMFAASFVLYNMSPNCPECGECQTTLTVMGVWFIANPGERLWHVV
jgi:hypothetical protein